MKRELTASGCVRKALRAPLLKPIMILDREAIDSVLARVGDIPTLPSTVFHTMQLTDEPSCGASDLAAVLMTDPPLAARILKLANSSYYGFSQKIASVHQAITLLGFSTLRNVLLSATVFDFYRAAASSLDLGELWKHSIASAVAGKLIARRVRYPHGEKAYTVGLLHDIGKVIIARYCPDELSEIMERVEKEHCSVLDAEEFVLGTNHAEVGSAILERWKLPVAIVDAVAYHHRPAQFEDQFYAAAIACLSNVLAHRSEIGNSGDNLARELDPRVRDEFSLSEADLDELLERLLMMRPEIESFSTLASNRE